MVDERIKNLLDQYSKYQKIEVCYHPHNKMSWGRNRKIYDGDCDLDYNHRQILDFEVVFDFDASNIEENLKRANEVMDKLLKDDIFFHSWTTGNKGVHIHTFWAGLGQFKDVVLMKKAILKHYAFGMEIDYQLAGKHLIRMEYGKNENKLNKFKEPYKENVQKEYKGVTLISVSYINDIPKFIIDEYQEELHRYIIRRLEKTDDTEINDTVKQLLEGQILVEDGRERMLFYLIHHLKERMTYDDMVSKLTSWYRYNSGTKLTNTQIAYKIRYHMNKSYSFRKDYLDDILEKARKTNV